MCVRWTHGLRIARRITCLTRQRISTRLPLRPLHRRRGHLLGLHIHLCRHLVPESHRISTQLRIQPLQAPSRLHAYQCGPRLPLPKPVNSPFPLRVSASLHLRLTRTELRSPSLPHYRHKLQRRKRPRTAETGTTTAENLWSLKRCALHPPCGAVSYEPPRGLR